MLLYGHIGRIPKTFVLDNVLLFSDPFDTVKTICNPSGTFAIQGIVIGSVMNMVSADSYNVILETLKIPGLTIREKEFHAARDSLYKDTAVFFYKRKSPSIWAVFTGGTGTGKSTLFNTLCGSPISRTGLERPTTEAPVLYIHRKNALGKNFPFPEFRIMYAGDVEDGRTDVNGAGKRLIVIEHDRDDLEHLVLVDNPDLDSLEAENRRMAEDLHRLSDVIVFVASQEKYADEIPSRTLSLLGKEGKPLFFLFNKADPANTPEEIIDFFRARGIVINDKRIWFIPYTASPLVDSLARQEDFSRFSTSFHEILQKKDSNSFLIEQIKQRRAMLKKSIDVFLDLVELERTAGDKWLERLDMLFKGQGRDLINQCEARFKEDNQGHIQQEIKNIYSRYDILSKPRHYVRQLLLAPFRLLGLRGKKPDRAHRRELSEIRKQTDITPILSAVSACNRLVLETLSPENHDSLFFRELRGDEIALSDKRVRSIIEQLQEEMMEWLEGKFSELARGIPKYKELGIYSTAIVWGGLILSFEIVLGGGITFIEVALDSFLAPLVTKGSVNIFAFHEIQNVARELDKKYKKGIMDILEEQKQRYVSRLQPLMIKEEAIEGLRALKAELGE